MIYLSKEMKRYLIKIVMIDISIKQSPHRLNMGYIYNQLKDVAYKNDYFLKNIDDVIITPHDKAGLEIDIPAENSEGEYYELQLYFSMGAPAKVAHIVNWEGIEEGGINV